MKAAVIIGGTRGLGRALSLALGEAGYFVLPIYKSDQKSAASLELELQQKKIQGRPLKIDVTSDQASIELKQVPELESAEHVVLIMNACSPFHPQALHTLSPQDFKDQLDIVRGSIESTLALLRKMLKGQRPTIISVLSSAIKSESMPSKGFSAYVTAKYALLGFTKSLAAEYHDRGLRAFSVSPGFMDTDLTARWDQALKAGAVAPSAVAKRILDLINDEMIPANGEEYKID